MAPVDVAAQFNAAATAVLNRKLGGDTAIELSKKNCVDVWYVYCQAFAPVVPLWRRKRTPDDPAVPAPVLCARFHALTQMA